MGGMKQIALALTLMLAAAPAAQASSQLRAAVARDLPGYVRGVDVSQLSTAQLGGIYAIIHSPRSESDKRRLIKSSLGGRHSLRSLFGVGN